MLAVHDSYAVSVAATARLSSLGYSGEHFDAKAQQQYLRARFYNPANGRFNRLDPFAGNMQDPQSLHKYTYVHGDPIQGIDPTGEFVGSIAGLLASVTIGGGVDSEYSREVASAGGQIASGLVGQQVHLDPMSLAISALLGAIGLVTDFIGSWFWQSDDGLNVLEQGIFVESDHGSLGHRVSEATALNWATTGINEPIEYESPASGSAAGALADRFAVGRAARRLFVGVSKAKYPVQLVLKSGKEKAYVASHAMLGKFNKATGISSSTFQKNHLNQNAAFRNLGPKGGIPYGQGLAVNLRGGAKEGLEHTRFHEVLDKFWAKYRGKAKKPTVGQYNVQLEKALKAAGYTRKEAETIADLAIKQQKAYGIKSSTKFTHIPHPTV